MTDTIKRSYKRSSWQIKKNHDIHHLAYFESIIRPCLRELGIDPENKDNIITMRYESEEFDDYQIVLEFQEYNKLGPLYNIVDSRFGDHLLGLRGYPNRWMMDHLPDVEKIYLRFN